MSEGRSDGVQVKESPVAVPVGAVRGQSLLQTSDENILVKVSTVLRFLESPFWRTMVQPLSQPEYLRVKGLPSSTSKALLRNWGAAITAEAIAARVTKEYFILKVLLSKRVVG